MCNAGGTDDDERRTAADFHGRKTTAKSSVGGAAKSAQRGRSSHPNFKEGPLVYEPAKKVESEDEKVVRYERVIEKLRKMMEHERKLLKTARV